MMPPITPSNPHEYPLLVGWRTNQPVTWWTIMRPEMPLELSMTNQDGTELSKETIFDLLKNQRRRRMLDYLDEQGGSASLTELAKTITAKEDGVGRSSLAPEQHKHVYVSLYQTHIPKMEGADVIDYYPDNRVIELKDRSEILYTYLDFDPEKEQSTADSSSSQLIDKLRSSILP